MNIDTLTALLCYMVANLASLFCLIFIFWNNRKDIDGVRSFISMYILMIAGTSLVIFRGKVPDLASITAANLLLTLSRYCMLRGLSRLLGKKYSLFLLIAAIVLANAGLAYFTYVDNNLQSRIIIFSMYLFLAHFISLLMLLSEEIKRIREKGLMVIILLVFMASNMTRVLISVFANESGNNLLSLQYDPIALVIDAILSLLFVVGIVSILNGKNMAKLEEYNSEKGFFANIYEISPVPIFVVSGDDRIVNVNQALCQLTMQNREALINSDWIEVFVPDYLKFHIRKSIHDNNRGLKIYHTTKVLKYDGLELDAEMFIECHTDEFGVLDHYFVFLHDLTTIKMIEAEAREADRQKTSILSNIPGFTYRCLMDRDWSMLEISGRFTEMTGYDPKDLIENQRISFNDIIAEEFRDEIWEAWNESFGENQPYIGEYKIKKADGDDIWVWEHGKVVDDSDPDRIVLEGFITDVTARKQLEEKNKEMEAYLRNQQKLEAIGTLAAGVAHEINNPVNGIMNYAQLIAEAKTANEEIAGYAEEIVHESERVADIVRNLLQFSGNREMGPGVMDIEEPFRQTVSLFKATIRKSSIEVRVSMEKNIPEILCDCTKMQQVLMNLLTNAKDSLDLKYPQYDDDKIISIHAGTHRDREGSWVRISVEDHGTGISKDIQPHIFEPFFTTKDRTKGTGLGLAISHGIIKDHKGRLTFETEPGKFTRFHIDLPV